MTASQADAWRRKFRSIDSLTKREKEVIDLLYDGLSNKEIAQVLGISPRTVEVHRGRVYEKLGCRNVVGLIRIMSEQKSKLVRDE